MFLPGNIRKAYVFLCFDSLVSATKPKSASAKKAAEKVQPVEVHYC